MAGEDDLLNMNFEADDEGEILVTLPGDSGDVKIVKAEDGKKPDVAKVDDPVDDLKSQFATMTQRATAAEQEAQRARDVAEQASQRAHALEGQVVSSQLDTVLSGIAAADAEATSAEQEYTAAFEAGDAAAMARAQRKMAGAEARKLRLVEAKDDLEEAAKRRPTEPQKPRQQPAQRPADPIEDFIQRTQLKGPSADFIRRNPTAATDPKVNARMMAAHNLAVADDVEIESPEYFRRIEEGIKGVKKEEPQQQRRPAAPAGPAGGAGGSAGGGAMGGGTEVRLTKGEAASATDGTIVWNYDDPSGKGQFKKGDPIGLAEMARRKYLGKKAGLYDRNNIEA